MDEPSSIGGFWDAKNSAVNLSARNLALLLAGDNRPKGQRQEIDAATAFAEGPRQAMMADRMRNDPTFTPRNVMTHELAHGYLPNMGSYTIPGNLFDRMMKLHDVAPDVPFYNSHLGESVSSEFAPIVARYIEGRRQGIIPRVDYTEH
jgi:hypothetical protein